MTVFFRLLKSVDLEDALLENVNHLNEGEVGQNTYYVNSESFQKIPTYSFAYWVSQHVRDAFDKLPRFQSKNRIACDTNPAGDDTRYFRNWWEVRSIEDPNPVWVPLAKGGSYNPYYADLNLVVIWDKNKNSYHGFLGTEHRPLERPASLQYFFEPGLTWSRRSQKGLSMRVLPRGAIFAQKGPGVFFPGEDYTFILSYLSIINSTPYKYLASLQMSFGAYEVGVIQRTPVPRLGEDDKRILSDKAKRIILLKMELSSFDETAHGFIAPELLVDPLGKLVSDIHSEISKLLEDIDILCFELYSFTVEDRNIAIQSESCTTNIDSEFEPLNRDEKVSRYLSWAIGVSFGVFTLEVKERNNNYGDVEEIFKPLPNLSPAMVGESDHAFHGNNGILVDDVDHENDLIRIIENISRKTKIEIGSELRCWLRKEYFSEHLNIYSKSRRQAPIYWPLQTPSSSYTLWVYYHRLNQQTIYTCVNDFVEPKLKNVAVDLGALRNISTRNTQEEKNLANLTDLEAELKDFRDELLRIAKFWKPNLNDGVQITAAPLWKLFQHKAWQKKLKETWESLEKGDYDWAHLACSIWPERVLRKCHQDRSLAIAHDVEEIFWHEVEVPVKRGKKATGETKLEWKPKELTDADLNALIKAIIKEKSK